jgi:hypothetical protein
MTEGRRTPYRDKVLAVLGDDYPLTSADEARIDRCARFLKPAQCAAEIRSAHAPRHSGGCVDWGRGFAAPKPKGRVDGKSQ